MANTMQEILEQTRKLVAVKQAEFKSNIAGGEKSAKGLDASGAGDDMSTQHKQTLTATEPALEPKKEPAVTSDAKAEPPTHHGPTSSNKAEGKNEGNQTDRTDALEATDPASVSQSKKPAITADAGAKHADDATAKIANDLLKEIREAKKDSATPKVAAEQPKAGAPAAPAAKEEKKEEKKEEAKAASGFQLELTTDVLAKIASTILATEEGANLVEAELAKAAGSEAAQEVLQFLAEQSELAEKEAAYRQGEADAQALIDNAIYQAGIAAGQDKQAMAKLGQAVADAGIDQMMAGAAPEAGAMPEAGMGGGEEISEEEIAEAIQSLIADGTISEEEAVEILQALLGGEGDVAGAGMPEAAPAGAPAAPAAEVAAEGEAGEDNAAPKEEKKEEKKEASDKASTLLDAIRQLRAGK